MSCELDKCSLNLEQLNQINKDNSHRIILGKGSYGIVLKPSILTNSTKHVTKLFILNLKKSRDDEYISYDIINKFDPHGLFTLKKQIIVFSGFGNEFETIQPKFLENINGFNYLEPLPFINSEYGGLELKEMKEINFNTFWNQLIILLEGIKHLNSYDLIHRDIKEVNILYTKDKLNLIDFGLKIHKDNIFKKDELNILKYKYPYYPPEFQFIAYLYENYNTPTELKKIVIEINKFLKTGKSDDELIINIVNYPKISELFRICYSNMQYEVRNKKDSYLNILKFLKKFFENNLKITDQIFNQFKTTEDIILHLFDDDCIKNKIDIYSLGITLYVIVKNASYDNFRQNNVSYEFLEEIIHKMTNENVYERSTYKDIIKMIKNKMQGGSYSSDLSAKSTTSKKSISKTKMKKSTSKKLIKDYETPKSPKISIEKKIENTRNIIKNMKNNKRLMKKINKLFS